YTHAASSSAAAATRRLTGSCIHNPAVRRFVLSHRIPARRPAVTRHDSEGADRARSGFPARPARAEAVSPIHSLSLPAQPRLPKVPVVRRLAVDRRSQIESLDHRGRPVVEGPHELLGGAPVARAEG